MKLTKKTKIGIAASIIGATTLTVSIATPIAVCSKTNTNKIQYNSAIKSINYESYLSKTNLNEVDKMISNGALSLVQDNNTLLVKADSQPINWTNIVQKAKIIAKNLFDKKISLNTLMNKLNEKENKL